MPKETRPEFIESTAGQVATELARRGVAPEQRVTITIEPDEPDGLDPKTKVRTTQGDRRRLDGRGN